MFETGNLKIEHSEGLKCGYGLNWYAYANNNPLRFVDPTGLNDEDFVAKMAYNRNTNQLFVGAKITDNSGNSKTIQLVIPMFNNVRPTTGNNPTTSFIDKNHKKQSEQHFAAQFPLGFSNVTDWKYNDKMGPTIYTDAHQELPVAERNSSGEIVNTEQTMDDYGYNLHGGDHQGNTTGDNNVEDWTDGCGRGSNDDIEGLFEQYLPMIKETGQEQLETVDDWNEVTDWKGFDGVSNE